MIEIILGHYEGIVQSVTSINRRLTVIERKIAMAATQQDLDNAISQIESAVSTLGTDLTQAIKDLQDKINAGGGTADLQPEVDRINAIAQNLATFDASAKAADPGPIVTGNPPTA